MEGCIQANDSSERVYYRLVSIHPIASTRKPIPASPINHPPANGRNPPILVWGFLPYWLGVRRRCLVAIGVSSEQGELRPLLNSIRAIAFCQIEVAFLQLKPNPPTIHLE